MRHQAIRAAALMLGVLLVGVAPARAASITFEDVVRAVGASGQVRPADEVRLRVTSQSGRAAGLQNPPAQTAESSAPSQQADGPASGGAPTVTAGAADPSLSQTGGGQVETVDLGDVTGTVCDCGEIPLPPDLDKGGFPWWLLGGIPLICVSGICFDSSENPPPNNPPGSTPTPTPPPNPIPEPATLLLFGSGLLAIGARARRRFGRKDFDTQTAHTAEEV